jgi:hypothetical protein
LPISESANRTPWRGRRLERFCLQFNLRIAYGERIDGLWIGCFCDKQRGPSFSA